VRSANDEYVSARCYRATRPKSDVLDCQWLQRLHSYGLLTASFRPADQVVVLRSYLRQRQMLIRYGSQHVQHMQKALEQMNVKLAEVVSDVSGVTGMAIIRAILRGERNPLELAKLRNDHCKRTEAQIARALYGNWRAEHLFAVQQAVTLYDCYRPQLQVCDDQLHAYLGTFADQSQGRPPGVGRSIPVRKLSIDRLREAIRIVLGNPAYRERAGRFQSSIETADGLNRAADLIEGAFGTRRRDDVPPEVSQHAGAYSDRVPLISDNNSNN
jgi:hypothetical protein